MYQQAQELSYRRGRMQQNGNDWTINLEPGNLYEDHQTRLPLVTVRLNLTFQSHFAMGEFPDRVLIALHDMIGRYLQLPTPPVQVHVELRTPPRRRRRAPSEPVAPADDEVALIKRRMLEGK